MPGLRIDNFSGIVPRTGPTELEGNQAQIANNAKLTSLELRPWKSPTLAYTPAGGASVQTIYKFQGQTGTSPIWLEWNYDVDVVPGPVADLSEFRLYYTSSGFSPKKTNWALASSSGAGTAPYPNAQYEMGVPAPTGAPTLARAGTGTSPTEDRAYIYTYVTVFGSVSEESAPSPATNITVNTSGDPVTISGFASPPAGNYNFQYKRIYRSVIGSTTASYLLVAEIPIATSSYTDSKTTAQLGSALTSLYYTPPPSTLQGLVSMPNGMLAGFTGNQVWFCEPYLPHAWPSLYMMTTDYPIVGLGVFNNSLFVGTTRNPYMITGSTPSSMVQEKLPMVQPCISKKSIVSDQYGVLYASPNGLASVAPGTQEIISNALYTRDEWQALNPSTMIGAVYNNMYFGFYQLSGGTRNSIIILRGDNPPLATFDSSAKARFVESNTGIVYYLSATDNKIYSLDSSTSSNTVFQWKSKKFLQLRPTTFASLQLHADYVYMAANAGSYVTVKLYADGALVFTGDITDDQPVRLPAITRSYYWEIELVGNVPVRRIAIATSVAELAGA
jgi:hypothetical protein